MATFFPPHILQFARPLDPPFYLSQPLQKNVAPAKRGGGQSDLPPILALSKPFKKEFRTSQRGGAIAQCPPPVNTPLVDTARCRRL
jgi:hypothetical protein